MGIGGNEAKHLTVRDLGAVDWGELVRVDHRLVEDDDFPTQRDWLTGVKLTFECETLVICVDERDDTISLSTVAGETGWRDVSSTPFWAPAIHKGPQWIWTMTNQQGYEDGCQIQF